MNGEARASNYVELQKLSRMERFAIMFGVKLKPRIMNQEPDYSDPEEEHHKANMYRETEELVEAESEEEVSQEHCQHSNEAFRRAFGQPTEEPQSVKIQPAPYCPACGHGGNMVFHEDAQKWACHGTHVVEGLEEANSEPLSAEDNRRTATEIRLQSELERVTKQRDELQDRVKQLEEANAEWKRLIQPDNNASKPTNGRAVVGMAKLSC